MQINDINDRPSCDIQTLKEENNFELAKYITYATGILGFRIVDIV